MNRAAKHLLRLSNASTQTKSHITADFALFTDIISESEHDALVKESREALYKVDWNKDHFDSVIVNFREVAIRNLALYPTLCNLYSQLIIPRFFGGGRSPLEPHVLELAADGYIKPHLDNVRRLSCTFLSIVGIQLLGSPSHPSGS